MPFQRLKISTRILAGFALVLVCMIILGIVAVISERNLAETTNKVIRSPFTVTSASLSMKVELIQSQKELLELVQTRDKAEAEFLVQKIRAHGPMDDGLLKLIHERFLGAPKETEDVDRALAAWRDARDRIIALVGAGRPVEAEAMLNRIGKPLGGSLIREIDDVLTFASGRAERFKGEAAQQSAGVQKIILFTLMGLVVATVGITLLITRSVGQSIRLTLVHLQGMVEALRDRQTIVEAIGNGQFERDMQVIEPMRLKSEDVPDDDLGALIAGLADLSRVQNGLDLAFLRMGSSLRAARTADQERDWLMNGLGQLSEILRSDQHSRALAERIIRFLAEYLKAGAGALYLFDAESRELVLNASYAENHWEPGRDRFRLGEGILGQAALDGKMIHLDQVPGSYLPIASALGEGVPGSVAAVPLLHNGVLIGALELGTFRVFIPTELGFLLQSAPIVASGLGMSVSRQEIVRLLAQSQTQEEELRAQQEELQQSNEELEERAQLLEQQREEIRKKSHDLEEANREILAKAAEVAQVSSYKSQFLANMSHELRTPLNSLMILSRLLADNKAGNLTEKQVDFANTIHGAGQDLLTLINDVLDISKIESGHMDYVFEEVTRVELVEPVIAIFKPLAEDKGLDFKVNVDSDPTLRLRTDVQRTRQILKNLLANAIKFTERGGVSLESAMVSSTENALGSPAWAFTVRDTGIGIPRTKFDQVFQSFQQAESDTSRRFGGTGLGLSISRQLARGMGGDLVLESLEGLGSTLTLLMPVDLPGEPPPARTGDLPATPRPAEAGALPDDREHLKPGERCILIVEDDRSFASTLIGLVREHGLAALHAQDGQTGIAMAEAYLPSAILLDVILPGLDGWGVMQKLTDNLRTRHIPVHFITALEERPKAMAMGAMSYLTKPVHQDQVDAILSAIEDSAAQRVRNLLLVEDNPAEAKGLCALMENRQIRIHLAASGAEAIHLFEESAFDCMVLDLGLADMTGFDVLEHMQGLDSKRRVPVIIHSGRDLTKDERNRLERYSESIILKGTKSPERLLNEVTLFLHVMGSEMLPEQRRLIRASLGSDGALKDKQVLVADDDMRNVFSLASVLSDQGMTVVEAENGREALAQLEAHPEIAIVLMDVMMPEMDGLEAIRSIRSNPAHAGLPIIALTAKAMKSDRESCLEAGASDYLCKPIDTGRLLSLLRVWLYQ